MHSLPFVSIIIPNFNGREYLDRCFSSLMELDYPKENLEVILVNDSPDDGTTGLVKQKFPSIKIIQNKKTQGPAGSRNIGVKVAKGSLIAFLDNDVEVESNWLKSLVRAITRDNRIGICSSKILSLDNKRELNSAGGAVNIYGDGWGRGVFEQDNHQYDSKRDVFFGCSAAMLTKKEVIERIGCFDKDYFYLYEDLDYGWRANLAGFKSVYVPESVVYHKFGVVMKRGSSIVRYFTERNRILTLLKNYEIKTLIKILPQFLKQRASKTIYARKIKKMKIRCFISFSTAWLWNIFHIFATLRKRTKVQSIRRIPDKEILNLMGDYRFKVFMN